MKCELGCSIVPGNCAKVPHEISVVVVVESFHIDGIAGGSPTFVVVVVVVFALPLSLTSLLGLAVTLHKDQTLQREGNRTHCEIWSH